MDILLGFFIGMFTFMILDRYVLKYLDMLMVKVENKLALDTTKTQSEINKVASEGEYVVKEPVIGFQACSDEEYYDEDDYE